MQWSVGHSLFGKVCWVSIFRSGQIPAMSFVSQAGDSDGCWINNMKVLWASTTLRHFFSLYIWPCISERCFRVVLYLPAGLRTSKPHSLHAASKTLDAWASGVFESSMTAAARSCTEPTQALKYLARSLVPSSVLNSFACALRKRTAGRCAVLATSKTIVLRAVVLKDFTSLSLTGSSTGLNSLPHTPSSSRIFAKTSSTLTPSGDWVQPSSSRPALTINATLLLIPSAMTCRNPRLVSMLSSILCFALPSSGNSCTAHTTSRVSSGAVTGSLSSRIVKRLTIKFGFKYDSRQRAMYSGFTPSATKLQAMSHATNSVYFA
mmetsp:Transcript_103456/g.292069  ORF Transcript_103456/g.292069 Transcript_103456/m.292069 type:complete len:320 (+) Transcript_103456:89-1048(+)